MSQLSGVEVRATSGAWQPGANIINYNPETEIITVGFQDDLNRTQEVPIGDVRFAAPARDADVSFAEGDEVEVLWKTKSDGPTQWFSGKVRNVKGGFFVCEFVHFGQPSSDVFEEKNLRVPNTNPCLSGTDFCKATIDIPEELHEFCNTHSDAHRDFQKACEAMTIHYIDGHLVILSRKNVSRRVDMIKEFHIKNLMQKMRLADRLSESQKMLEQSKLVAESCCEKFKVDPELVKFVVGTKGSNIAKARSIPGVIQVSIDDPNHTVMIYAETPEVAKKARLLLEFTEEHYLVPRNLVGRIIGQKGKSIQDIIDKSHVLKVRVLSEEDSKAIPGADDPTYCAFKFIGTRINNLNAKALMDYLVQSLKEIDELQDEQKDIETKIGSYNILPTYSNGNGNSSGYSSDNRDQSYKYNNRRNRKGDNTDSESENNRNGKGNYKARNQKPRDNRIEEHKRHDHIEQRNVQGQQNKPKMNRFEMLGDCNQEEIQNDFGSDWSEVPGPQVKKELSSGDAKGQYARVAAGAKNGTGLKKTEA